MQRINLPSGQTADLRDVADVTERMRRPLKRNQAQLVARPAFAAAVRAAQSAEKNENGELTPEEQTAIGAGLGDAFDLLEDLNDHLCVALTAGWSYGFAVSMDSLQDLPGRDLDALRKACSPFLNELLPNFEPSPDDASPIAPSGV